MSDARGGPDPGPKSEFTITPRIRRNLSISWSAKSSSKIGALGGQVKLRDPSTAMVVVEVPDDSVKQLTSLLGANFQIDPNARFKLL